MPMIMGFITKGICQRQSAPRTKTDNVGHTSEKKNGNPTWLPCSTIFLGRTASDFDHRPKLEPGPALRARRACPWAKRDPREAR